MQSFKFDGYNKVVIYGFLLQIGHLNHKISASLSYFRQFKLKSVYVNV